MDNLAHALVGAALGRATAGHRVPRAAWLGAVAANAPDWSEFFTGFPWAGAEYLARHRGVTHSLLGVALEIAGMTLLVGWGTRWWARRRGRGAAPPWGWILACVAAATLSHPFMDWQGSYGLRPFLPWSDQWYYGDFVAIVDPLYWILPLVALALGARRHWAPALGFLAIAVAVLLLLFLTSGVVWWLRWTALGSCVAAVLGWQRHWIGMADGRRAAAWAMGLLALYAAAQGVASFPAKTAIGRAAMARFGTGPDTRWAALTNVGAPFTWEPIYASRDSVAGDGWQAPRHLDLPVVQRALVTTSDGRAIARFARFLAADVDSLAGGPVRVRLRDARYQPVGRNGWATVTVSLE